MYVRTRDRTKVSDTNHLPGGRVSVSPILGGRGSASVAGAGATATRNRFLDWERLSSLPCYATAYVNTWHVAQCLAVLAVSLMPLGINPHFIHVVGFSLGAHIAGLAGANLKQTLGYSFGRITGLDPALPLFATLNNDWKLDPSDAQFVDVIHTSAGTFGKIEPTGHADFYVIIPQVKMCFRAKRIGQSGYLPALPYGNGVTSNLLFMDDSI
ncbi:hypothetical protein NQ318_016632 [Aromia moschata]|uniref:Lipase domain-containing protein n=1 Tax=Aromia moschata TaxID=1265417 RepID=A0AAV8X8T4_9CUCU|nr:hypothetical protein NQ318_016632 [Aromia moschata]